MRPGWEYKKYLYVEVVISRRCNEMGGSQLTGVLWSDPLVSQKVQTPTEAFPAIGAFLIFLPPLWILQCLIILLIGCNVSSKISFSVGINRSQDTREGPIFIKLIGTVRPLPPPLSWVGTGQKIQKLLEAGEMSMFILFIFYICIPRADWLHKPHCLRDQA